MKTFFTLCLVALVGPLIADAANEPHWPRWRGPTDAGRSVSGEYAARWSEGKNVEWKLALPAKGCSTPIVLNEQIVLNSPLKESDAAMGISWDAQVQWQRIVGPQRAGKHRNRSGSNPSPSADASGIYVYFKSGAVAGLDHQGNLRWKANLQDRYGADTLYWDIGSSPVVTSKNVIFAVMHDREGYLVAFEKQTGELLWKIDRTYETPTENDHSYATPWLVDHQGNEAIVV